MCKTCNFKIVPPNKLVLGKIWGDFFKKCQKCQCSGNPFEGKAASENFLKQKQLLEEFFVLPFFRSPRFWALSCLLFFLAVVASPIFTGRPPQNHARQAQQVFKVLLAGPTTRRTFCAPAFLRIARVWGAGLAPPIVAMSSQFSTSGKVTFSVGGTSAESAIQGDSSPPHPQNSH